VLAVADERGPGERFTLHHYYEMLAHSQIDLYLGDGEAVRTRVAAGRKGMADAFLDRIQSTRIETEFLAGRAALAVAPSEPAALAEARQAIKRLERERVPWASAVARLLRGGLAVITGDARGAVAALELAERELTAVDMALFAQVARLRRGEAEGGPGGAARAAAAVDWMRDNAVADPAAIAYMLAPWRI
jgi:ATP/maltotriose-dependent transcriptional regulator MalT